MSEYEKSYIKINIRCLKCDKIFKQSPCVHLGGSGCPKCCCNISNKEIKWLDILNIPEENRQVKIIFDNKKYNLDALVDNDIYEFYGDYWHGNPAIYKSDEINKNMKKTFGEIYNNTMLRENNLRQLGYNVISMWENDFNI